MHFQARKLVQNYVNDSPSLITQQLVFCHRGHLGNELPVFAFTCTFYYQTYTHTVVHRIDLACINHLTGVVHGLFEGADYFAQVLVRVLIEGVVYSGNAV